MAYENGIIMQGVYYQEYCVNLRIGPVPSHCLAARKIRGTFFRKFLHAAYHGFQSTSLFHREYALKIV